MSPTPSIPAEALRIISLLTATLAVGACCQFKPSISASPPAPPEQHIVRVDRNGILLDLAGAPQSSTQAISYLERNILQPLDAALASGRYPKGVLIFAHGGLNTTDSALQHFQNSHAALMHDGYYPIFFVWPSDLGNTWWEHTSRIRQGVRESGRFGSTFAAMTCPVVFVQDIATGLVRTPMTVLQTVRSDMESALPVAKRYVDPVANYRALARKYAQNESKPLKIGGDYKTIIETAGRFISYIVTAPTKFASGGPIIDTLGRPAWDNMLRRTYMVYPGHLNNSHDSSFSHSTQPPFTSRRSEVKAAGFSLLIGALEERQRMNPFRSRVTLVGHSMGTIVLNHVLDETSLDVDRIIYLAAACSVRDYAASVLPYMQRHHATVFYSLMLHPEAELGERQTKMVDLPPRGSLLVWIDNFLSNPVSEQDRTFGRWSNLFFEVPSGQSAIESLLDHPVNGPAHPRTFFYAFPTGCGSKPRGPNYQWQDTTEEPVPTRPTDVRATPQTHSDLANITYWKPETWIGPGSDATTGGNNRGNR